MQAHFSGFTSDTMRAFGQELAAERQQRRELIEMTRSYTSSLLESARRLRREAEADRRQLAAQEADARKLFTSELRSEVHALRNRFALARRDVATDFQQMAGELRATREAFRNRPAHHAAPTARRAARPAAQPPSPSQQPAETAPASPESAAARPRHTTSERPDHSKKRHG
ncbi:MAG TPA: hypothetical protein VEW48_09960 [Thermoanaerobaculia bacterium]|nr:hypothetical protein [Thermoanaerobaculia bacterium]